MIIMIVTRVNSMSENAQAEAEACRVVSSAA